MIDPIDAIRRTAHTLLTKANLSVSLSARHKCLPHNVWHKSINQNNIPKIHEITDDNIEEEILKSQEQQKIKEPRTIGLSYTTLSPILTELSTAYPEVDPSILEYIINDVYAYGYTSSDINDGRIVAFDFDGVIAERATYPDIGKPIEGAVETIANLKKEGWYIYIHSSRAGMPGGKQQIADWALRYGLQIDAILSKPFAKWYVDDQAMEFNNNWEYIYKNLHYDIPVEFKEPSITASSIRNGLHSFKTIVSALGFDPDELKYDISEIYKPLTTVESALFENKFKAKYSLNIVLADIAKSKDTEAYWRTKFAELLEKITINKLDIGDSVLIADATVGNYFGETGTIINLKNDIAEIALDTSNEFITVKESNKKLKLLAGDLRYALTDMSDVPLISAAYPTGISFSDIQKWYSLVLPEIVSNLQNINLEVVYRLSNLLSISSTLKINKNIKLNINKLLAVNKQLTNDSDELFIKLDSADISKDGHELLIHDLVAIFASFNDIRDINLVYSGDTAVFIELKLKQPIKDLKAYQKHFANLINMYLEDTHNETTVIGPLTAQARSAIDPFITTMPVRYSINAATRLVCVPIQLDDLKGFDPKSATIQCQLAKIRGETVT